MAKVIINAEVKNNVALVLAGLNAGITKADVINSEKKAKELLKSVAATLDAAKVYIINGGGELTSTQLARLTIWYREVVKKALTSEQLLKKYAAIPDSVLVDLLKARGYKKIQK